jgi:hypothetical protein
VVAHLRHAVAVVLLGLLIRCAVVGIHLFPFNILLLLVVDMVAETVRVAAVLGVIVLL